MELTTGTAIEDAIKSGKKGYNCENSYPACKFNSNSLDVWATRFFKSYR